MASGACLYGTNQIRRSQCALTPIQAFTIRFLSGYKVAARCSTHWGPVYSAQRFQDKIDISADHRACTLPDPARCRPLLPLLLLSDVTLARLSS